MKVLMVLWFEHVRGSTTSACDGSTMEAEGLRAHTTGFDRDEVWERTYVSGTVGFFDDGA